MSSSLALTILDLQQSLRLSNAVLKMAYGFPALGKMFSHFKCVLYSSTRPLRLSAISKELASSADTGTGRWEMAEAEVETR